MKITVIPLLIIPLVIFLTAGPSAHAFASPDWTITELITAGSDYDSRDVALAAGADGTIHAVWSQNSVNFFDTDIYYISRQPGGAWSTPELVSSESPEVSGVPAIAVALDGSIHVVWQDGTDNYGGSGTDVDIFYKCKPRNGSWTLTEVVSIESSQVSFNSQVAVSTTGAVHVVWVERKFSYEDYDIYYKYKPAGQSWTAVEVITPESTETSSNPHVAVGLEGTVHVMWQDMGLVDGEGKDGVVPDPVEDIYYRYKPPGGGWTAPELVSWESLSGSYHPDMFLGLDGTVHAAWMDTMPAGGDDIDIYYSEKPAAGAWTAAELVSQEGGKSSEQPELVVGLDGTVHVAWHERSYIPSVGSAYNVCYKKRTVEEVWIPWELVSSESPYFSYFPDLALEVSGAVHVAWFDNTDYLGCGTDLDIFSKMRPAEGNILEADNYQIHPGSGGTSNFSLRADPVHAGRQYLIMAGLSGTRPGTPFPGGKAVLPLKWDLFTDLVLLNVNTIFFSNFMGTLDGGGEATALLNIPPLTPGLFSGPMYFAYALPFPWDQVSNPIAVNVMD